MGTATGPATTRPPTTGIGTGIAGRATTTRGPMAPGGIATTARAGTMTVLGAGTTIPVLGAGTMTVLGAGTMTVRVEAAGAGTTPPRFATTDPRPGAPPQSEAVASASFSCAVSHRA
jgi:hypothetical protein